MKINRRNFVKSLGASAIALSSMRLENFGQNSPPARPLKIVVFWEEDFPIVEGLNLTAAYLRRAFAPHATIFARADELKIALAQPDVDVFVNPFGSAFPKSAWTEILKYLQAGGNFLNLGGKTFSIPVKKQNGVWTAESEQVGYHRRLGIVRYSDVFIGAGMRYEASDTKLNPAASEYFNYIYEAYARLTNSTEFPEESGSDGRREANLQALMFAYNSLGTRAAAPVVCFDRLRGEFAGGRWIFFGASVYRVQIDKIDAGALRALAETASFGAFEYDARPVLACVRAGEPRKLKIKITRPANQRRELEIGSSPLEIINSDGSKTTVESDGASWSKVQSWEFEFALENILDKGTSGFYEVLISFPLRIAGSSVAYRFKTKTGFYLAAENSISPGAAFTADRHFLYRNGEPFPVVGTTYMASDVHRRFLLEPNPAVWNKDFAKMKKAGVNMVRTGIWTGWKLMLDEKGEVKESVLRAFEAFLLTARKYDIPIIFTFFAFLPEMFGGENAYLDSGSTAAQKKFIAAFARRASAANDVIWDLINEPSFANPKALWSCRPNRDVYEKAAWREWLLRRYAAQDEMSLREILMEKWRLAAEENPFDLPNDADFENANFIGNRRLLRARDFRLFAQDVFEKWANEMRDALKLAGNKSQMITVGQDEAGTGDSPSPQFHSAAVDFTSLHNWWANDDLLWDNVVSKAVSKPSMIQETGAMSYEKADGAAWRDEAETERLVERKMALALGANACGFVQWIWNTNPYMNIDNEAGIGFLRADGTEKPELRDFERIARFAQENRLLFRGKQDEKTLLVIPHSAQFAPRSLTAEATRKVVRAFHYHSRRALRAVSEYRLGEILKEEQPPVLILLPSPRVLTDEAWQNILALVARGSTLAVTGYFADDEHFLPRPRLDDFGSLSVYEPVPVSSFERVTIDGKSYNARFEGDKLQRVEKAAFAQDYVMNFQYKGEGKVYWCSVPLELGETPEPIAAFYDYALKQAQLAPFFSLKTDTPAVLVRPTEFQDAILYLIVNENARSEYVELTHLPTKTKIEMPLNGGQPNLIFVDKKTGKILSRLY